jgi:hypothetical protein
VWNLNYVATSPMLLRNTPIVARVNLLVASSNRRQKYSIPIATKIRSSTTWLCHLPTSLMKVQGFVKWGASVRNH